MRRLLLPGTIAVALAFSASATRAQESRAYSLEQLKILIQGGLPAASILQRAARDCLGFKLDDDAVRQLRSAGATGELIDGLRSACVRVPQVVAAPPPAKVDTARAAQPRPAPPPARVDTARAVAPRPSAEKPAAVQPPAPSRPAAAAPAARRPYSPAGEAVRSLFVPGLGQFHTHRPALGADFLAGAGGALAFGLLSQRVTVNCLAPMTAGACPSGQVRDQSTARPMLVPGIGGFVALGVISAIEAASGARRANARMQPGAGDASGARLEWVPAVANDAGGTSIGLVRLRF